MVSQRAASDPYTGVIEAAPSFGRAIKAKAFDKRAIFASISHIQLESSTFKTGDTVPV